MTPTEELIAARAVIEDPDDWCIGSRVKRHETDFYRFQHCALGAIEMAQAGIKKLTDKTLAMTGMPEPNLSAVSVVMLAETIPAGFDDGIGPNWEFLPSASKVARYNNVSDHPTVLAWFDRAIARSSPPLPDCLASMLNVPQMERELEPA